MADFSVVKKGYDQDEVNEYISKLEEVINSYKEKDIAIKNAIISAQIAADNIVENAEIESKNKRNATAEILKNLKEDIGKYESVLNSFQSDYNGLIKKYLTNVNDAEFKIAFDKLYALKASIGVVEDKLDDKTDDEIKKHDEDNDDNKSESQMLFEKNDNA